MRVDHIYLSIRWDDMECIFEKKKFIFTGRSLTKGRVGKNTFIFWLLIMKWIYVSVRHNMISVLFCYRKTFFSYYRLPTSLCTVLACNASWNTNRNKYFSIQFHIYSFISFLHFLFGRRKIVLNFHFNWVPFWKAMTWNFANLAQKKRNNFVYTCKQIVSAWRFVSEFAICTPIWILCQMRFRLLFVGVFCLRREFQCGSKIPTWPPIRTVDLYCCYRTEILAHISHICKFIILI